MTAYYNEFDQNAAAWLRQLIADGMIAPGEVDTRSIADVRAEDLRGFAQYHFFAGIGGWSRALRLAGWADDRPVWTGSCPCQPFSSAGKQQGIADERHLWPVFFNLIRECRPGTIFGEQVEAAIRHGWLDLVQADLEKAGYAFGAVGLPAACVGAPHIRQRLWFVARSERLLGDTDGGQNITTEQGQPLPCEKLPTNTVADATGRRGLEEWRLPQDEGRVGTDGLADCSGTASPLDNPIDAGLEGQRRHEDRGRGWQNQARSASEAGFWSNPEWLNCRDGKARPTEPGVSPLVDGIPRGVVPVGDPSDTGYTNATAEARVMRLRGYGNAIVPQVAAEVIRAFMEVAA